MKYWAVGLWLQALTFLCIAQTITLPSIQTNTAVTSVSSNQYRPPTTSITISGQTITVPVVTLTNYVNPFPSQGSSQTDLIARLLAASGLVVTLLSFGFTIYKNKRDRKLSIEDDFWFRKIITPTTIEPMLKTMVDLLDSMPTRKSAQSDQRSYAIKVTKDFQRLNTSIQTLALFNAKLPSLVANKLSSCEDTLTNYSAQLAQPNSQKDSTITVVQQEVWSQLNDVLRVIRDEQLKH